MTHYRPTLDEVREAYATNDRILSQRAGDEAGDQARERLEKQFEVLIREVRADAYAQALDDLNGEGYLDTEAHEMYATFHNPYRRF